MSNPIARYNQRFPKKVEALANNQGPFAGDWGFIDGLELAREVIASLGLDVLGEKDASGGDHVFMLRHCAFNPDHTSNDAAIMVSQSGKLKYHCFHNSCSDKGWKELRDLSGVSKRQQASAEITQNHQESAKVSN